MTNHDQTPPAAPPGYDPYGEEPAKDQVNPLLRIHMLLYGRYPWAVVLAIVLSLGGAIAAWYAMPPKYEAIGAVHVDPYEAPVLDPTDVNGMLPSYDTFVNYQVYLLQSQRLLNQARLDSDWTALGKSSARWNDYLKVEHPRSSEQITVGYTDRDPNVAAIVVKSILKAYLARSTDATGEGLNPRLQKLDKLRSEYEAQRQGFTKQIADAAATFKLDPEELQQRYLFKRQEQNALDAELARIAFREASGAGMKTPATAPATQPEKLAASPPPAATRPVTRDEVARVDPQMQGYLDDETRLTLQISQLGTRVGDLNPLMRAARSDLQMVQDKANKLLATYQPGGPRADRLLPPAAATTVLEGMTAEQLQAQEKKIRDLLSEVQAEAKDLGQADQKIRTLRDGRDKASQDLEKVIDRAKSLQLEATSRIHVETETDRPTEPYVDRPVDPVPSKRIPVTVAVGFLGLALGAGLVALRGFADRRVRSLLHMEQAAPAIRVLGVLPVLPEDFADPDQVSLTANCVHQIRNLLDPDHAPDARRVLAVTSPMAGDGKTGLTLALGLSFAVSGSRTLLIDCDMVGGGLTSRLHAVAHPRLGTILKRLGKVTEQQIQDALLVAAPSHRKIGKALVDLGHAQVADIQLARSEQKKSSVGLLDALKGDPLADCVASVVLKDLFILPMGKARSENSKQISVKALHRIIEEARQEFDFILIDTGPIFGSIEASVAARVTDQVVLAVTRGTSIPLVTRVVQLLDSLGGHLAGVVFNRATPGDVAYSRYGSTSGSLVSVYSSGPARRTTSEPRSSLSTPPRLGPVAGAILALGNGAAKEPHANGRNGSTQVNGSVHGSAGTNGSAAPGNAGSDDAHQGPEAVNGSESSSAGDSGNTGIQEAGEGLVEAADPAASPVPAAQPADAGLQSATDGSIQAEAGASPGGTSLQHAPDAPAQANSPASVPSSQVQSGDSGTGEATTP